MVRFAVSLAVAFLLSASAVPQQTASTSNFLPKTQDRDRDNNERHPHIRSAIHELQEARKELQTAAHDFGGHRVEALRSCDEAIRQLQLAMQYDKK
jgi:hypothetical protein